VRDLASMADCAAVAGFHAIRHGHAHRLTRDELRVALPWLSRPDQRAGLGDEPHT
jgi:hypothetical protein